MASQVNQIKANLSQVGPQMQTNSQLTNIYQQLNININQLANKLELISNQNQKLTTALNQVTEASKTISTSGNKLSTVSNQVAGGMQQINTGVQILNGKVQQLGNQTNELAAGLNQAQSANQQILQGLEEIKGYLGELETSYLGKEFYLPQAKLDQNVLGDSYKVYLSKNGKITKLTIILNDDPNTLDAAKKLRVIENDAKAYLKGSKLKNVHIAFGGQTSQISDLEKLANKDLIRTGIIC